MQVGFKVSCYCASDFVATTNQDSSFASRQFDTTEEHQDCRIPRTLART